MARPDQGAIETFMSITGASESVAVQKLEEHGGDLNEAINAHFNEGDRNSRIRSHEAPTVATQEDAMDIDEPVPVGTQQPPFSFLPSTRSSRPFSLLDPDFSRRFLGSDISSSVPFISHPRKVREIPIEVKDGGGGGGEGSGLAPTIEDVTGTDDHCPETHGIVTINEDDEEIPITKAEHTGAVNVVGFNSHGTYPWPSAPGIDDLPDYHNDIEEEMVRAAIEASKKEVGKVHPYKLLGGQDELRESGTQQGQARVEDHDLAQAVSLSQMAAEQEKASSELGRSSELAVDKSTEAGDTGKIPQSNGRLDVGSSSLLDEPDDVEELPLVRHRIRPMSSTPAESAEVVGGVEITPPSSPGYPSSTHPLPQSGSDFHEWGGISSQEHDEAVMLEAAMFGGIPEINGYHFPHGPDHFMQNGFDGTSALLPNPRPPSPGLVAQRLIREQQDDEYLASLQADREKAEAQLLEEQAAREASLEEERRKEEDSRRKLEAEQEIERQLAAKEATLPLEPSPDDENAITLLVRMPDGSRCGRRFLKSDKLQFLFDFLDVGRVVKPGSYKLVRPYPRRAFSYGESNSSLNELGLTSKQEALFLEAI